MTASISDHAAKRWDQRFGGDGMAAAFTRSERVPFSRLLHWLVAHRRPPAFRLECEYRFDARTRALFVVGADGRVLTVFRFHPPG